MALSTTVPTSSIVVSHRVATTNQLGAATTYFYRTAGGTKGSTTNTSSIPVGAVVERIA